MSDQISAVETRNFQIDFNRAVAQLAAPDERSQIEAIATLKQLAAAGMAKAAYNVGVASLRGFHMEKNSQMAARFMLQAAEGGCSRAYYPLARLILAGHLSSCNTLPAECRRFISAKWFWRAAMQGDKRATGWLQRPWVPSIFSAAGGVGYK